MKQHLELQLVNSSELLEQVLLKVTMLENCNDLFLHILDLASHSQPHKLSVVTDMSNMCLGWPMWQHPVKRFSRKFATSNDQNFQKRVKGLMSRKQVGSSTMAHKKNPIKSENASGLARIVRSFIIPTYENALLWHERDLANSSSERFTLSHGSALCEDVIAKTRQVLTNMWVDAERCMENIRAQRGLVMAEKVMIDFVERGIPRDEAHEILREASFTAVANKEELIDVCSRTPAISAAFSAEELEAMFEPSNHIGVSGEIVDEAVALARAAIQTTE